MAFSDLDAALLCYSSYFLPGYFDHIFQGDDDDQVWCGIKHLQPGDDVIVVFRGSATLLDWSRDFKADMITDATLGGVEAGFIIGLNDLFPKIQKIIGLCNKIYVTGHSLGAARALLFGGLMVKSGLSPEIITFGSPRPAGIELKAILTNTIIRSYKNGFDPVTNVPLSLSIDPYVHPSDLLPVFAQPIEADVWLAMRDHHIQAYVNALALKLGDYHG